MECASVSKMAKGLLEGETVILTSQTLCDGATCTRLEAHHVFKNTHKYANVPNISLSTSPCFLKFFTMGVFYFYKVWVGGLYFQKLS